MKSITKEQEYFLYRFTRGTWKLNPETGLVDTDGNFDCSERKLSDFLGIEFGNINGSFNCYNNKLVSLYGSPKYVGGDFDCYNNQLVSLEDGPQEVGGSFDCSNNQLVSLKGAPKKFKGSFYCDPTSLRDCPIDLLDKIYFYNNKKYFGLKDYITMIINGLDPEIYLKKMI